MVNMSDLELGTLSFNPELSIVTFALLQVPELGAVPASSSRIGLGIVSSFTSYKVIDVYPVITFHALHKENYQAMAYAPPSCIFDVFLLSWFEISLIYLKCISFFFFGFISATVQLVS